MPFWIATGSTRFSKLFDGPARREHARRIVHANHLVDLDEIDHVGLEPLQRLVELRRGRRLGAPIELRHEEGLLPVPIAEGLAHSFLALTPVVVPRVVEERHSTIDGAADDAQALPLVQLFASVGAPETDAGYTDPGLPEDPRRHFARGGGCGGEAGPATRRARSRSWGPSATDRPQAPHRPPESCASRGFVPWSPPMHRGVTSRLHHAQ
jgi:hypothetical protein